MGKKAVEAKLACGEIPEMLGFAVVQGFRAHGQALCSADSQEAVHPQTIPERSHLRLGHLGFCGAAAAMGIMSVRLGCGCGKIAGNGPETGR
jgi:hypothetical protein